MTASPPSTNPIQVLERAHAVLSSFTRERPQLSLAMLVELLDMHKTTVHRILRSLESVGMLDRHDDLWSIGREATRLALVRQSTFDIQNETVTRLREVASRLGTAAAIGLLTGHEVSYVHRVEGPDLFGPVARLGASAPAWTGASGRALLSALTEPELERTLAQTPWQSLSKKERDRLCAQVADAAKLGYATDFGEYHPGVSGAAVAIRDPSGTPVCSVSLIVPSDGFDAKTAATFGKELFLLREGVENTARDYAFFVADNPASNGSTKGARDD